MKCDLCDEHVDPDDYQAHCEQHHCDGELSRREAWHMASTEKERMLATQESYALRAEAIWNDPRLSREGKLTGVAMLFAEITRTSEQRGFKAGAGRGI